MSETTWSYEEQSEATRQEGWAPPEPSRSELAAWVGWYYATHASPWGAILEMAERIEALEKAQQSK